MRARLPRRVFLTLVLATVAAVGSASPAYIRFPDLHGKEIVFTVEGDLWLTTDSGGTARRLTSHPGTEAFAMFSPDGAWIAFSGEYDGNQGVHVIPSGGAELTYPVTALNGPFVVLAKEFSGSDGDIFPAAVKLEKQAPIIGQRTWGGVVGCRCADKSMVDGGLLTQPEFAWNDPNGGWTIENHGVDPDIAVQTLPQELSHGVDAQLERAIDEVLALHQTHPPVKPDYGPVRLRGRQAFERELGRP
jgi:hypothetical protein